MNTLSMYGHGLTSPLQREGRDFKSASGPDLVRNCLQNLLGTVAAPPNGESGGEVPWDHTFGSRLSLLRHSQLGTTTDALARFYVESAIRAKEPRVLISEVRVIDDPSATTRYIRVQYKLISSNNPSNQVVLSQDPIAVEL